MIAPIIIGAVVILITMYVMSKKPQPQKIMLNTSGLNEEIDSNTEGPPPSTGIDDNVLPQRPPSNGNKSSDGESTDIPSSDGESSDGEPTGIPSTGAESSDGESTGAESTDMGTESLKPIELKPEIQDSPTPVVPQPSDPDPQHRGDGTLLEGMLNQDDAKTGVVPVVEEKPPNQGSGNGIDHIAAVPEETNLEVVAAAALEEPKPEAVPGEDQEQSSRDYLQYLLLMTYIYFFKAMIDQSRHFETYKKIKDEHIKPKLNENLKLYHNFLLMYSMLLQDKFE